jgi:GMP synthase (glutamine-hydrolysing)
MALELGGAVESNDVSEYGKADVSLDGTAALFHDLAAQQVVWMSHRDSVTAAPGGARVTASSETTPIAAFEDPDRGLYGVQFHP